jgi:hypothetical protein
LRVGSDPRWVASDIWWSWIQRGWEEGV